MLKRHQSRRDFVLIAIGLAYILIMPFTAAYAAPKNIQKQQCRAGELIVRLEDNASIEDIRELNVKYKLISIELIFKKSPALQDTLTQLKAKLTHLAPEHQSWYWQLDKTSSEYKEYTAKIKKEKETLSGQIQALGKLIDHIAQRKNRAPKDAQTPNLETTYLLKAPQDTDIAEMAQEYADNPSVKSAQPNYIMELLMTPNDTYADPDADGTWSHGAWGQAYDDLWGLEKINAEAAWDISQGEGVIVAVVDTGLDYNHEDIWDNVWVNPAVVTDTNPPFGVINLDDCDTNQDHFIEESEIIDHMFGWNFDANDKNPMDTNGHGTHCAGTIAAVGNNNQGIIGVAPSAKIMGIKTAMEEDDLAAAVTYAADMGADVISCSWGGFYQGTSALTTAIDYAYSQGCIVVAAAGNDNMNVAVQTPACLDNVIAVAATNQNDQKCDFSNFGTAVNVAAPGGDSAENDGPDGPTTWKLGRNILSLRAEGTDLYGNGDEFIGLPGGISFVPQFDDTAKYYRLRGTSMACPHVAGVAALVLSSYPNDTTEEIVSRITATSDPFSQEYFGMLGTGRVNAYKALTEERKPFIKIKEVYLQEQSGDGDQIPEPSETIQLILEVENVWEDAASVTIEASTQSDYIASIPTSSVDFGSIVQGQSKDNTTNPFIFTIAATPYQFDTPVTMHLEITADGEHQSLNITFSLGIRRLAVSKRYKSYLSASGSKLIWEDWRHDNAEIYMYDLATEQETRITDDTLHQIYPSISEDKIVWYDSATTRLDAFQLYDLETGQGQTIVEGSNYLASPYTMSEIPGSISGDKVIWLDKRNASSHGGNPDIYLYDVGLDQEQRITTDESQPKAPFISEDKIVWHDTRTGSSEIHLYDLTDQAEYQLTTDSGNTLRRFPSLFGDLIVWMTENYISAFEAEKYISLYDLNTSQQRRLSYNSITQTHPVIHDTNVAWCDYRNLNEDIYLFDVTTDQETAVTTSTSNQWSPSLAGNRLVWLDDSYSGYTICMTQIAAGDDIPPAINGPYVNDEPLDGMMINHDTALAWTHQDAGGSGLNLQAITCEYKPTGAPDTSYTSLENIHITDTDGSAEFNAESNPAITEGSYDIRIHVEDNAGLVAQTIDTVIVTFDITPPQAPLVTDDGAYTQSTTTLHATWTEAIDNESGIAGYEYAIGTNTATEEGKTNIVGWTSTGLDTSVTASGLSLENQTTYYFSIKAINGIGLSATGHSDGITVQGPIPPPTVSLEISTTTITAGEPFSLTLSGASEAGLASVWWFVKDINNPYVPGGPLPNIPGTVDGEPRNLAPAQDFGAGSGMTNYTRTMTVIIDEPGEYEITANARDILYWEGVPGAHQASEGAGIAAIPVNVAPEFSGMSTQYTVELGNSLSFTVTATDTDGDTLNLEAVDQVQGADFSVGTTQVLSDGTSKIEGTYTVTPAELETHSVRFRATDSNDASVTSEPVEILVQDRTLPEVYGLWHGWFEPVPALSQDTELWFGFSEEVDHDNSSWSYSGPRSGALTVEYFYMFGGWPCAKFEFPVVKNNLPSGTYTITGLVKDKAGNTTEVTYQVNIDTTPPEVYGLWHGWFEPVPALSQDTELWFGFSEEVDHDNSSWSYSGPRSGALTVEYFYMFGGWPCAKFEFPVVKNNLPSGTYTITGLVKDKAGNTTEVTYQVQVNR